MNTTIEWCDMTVNPVIGCTKVSPGCAKCYAETVAGKLSARFKKRAGARYLRVLDDKGRWKGAWLDRDYMRDAWRITKTKRLPSGGTRPARVFCVSMGDLFHEDLTDEEIADVLQWMVERSDERGPTWIVVTKRPERAAEVLTRCVSTLNGWPRIHLLTSVETQRYANERIPHLLECAPYVDLVGLSVEPMLGPVDLSRWICRLGWVIVGGESGTDPRSLDVRWVDRVVNKCWAAEVPCFVKQLGGRVVIGEQRSPDGGFSQTWQRLCQQWPATLAVDANGFPFALLDKKGGDPSQWPERLRVRQFPRC